MYDIVNTEVLMIVVLAMMAMLYTGTMDDILNLSPKLRFLIEIVVMLLLITYGGYSVNNFHGLWGIGRIPEWAAIILTLFASIGIINAINLIDGVNGLSSGFCILACSLFGVLFLLSGNVSMTILATASAGALIPFFFHNVFGKTSRMFIGDGGTLGSSSTTSSEKLPECSSATAEPSSWGSSCPYSSSRHSAPNLSRQNS